MMYLDKITHIILYLEMRDVPILVGLTERLLMLTSAWGHLVCPDPSELCHG